MCAQICIRDEQVDEAAARKYLTAKQRKKLRKRGHLTVDLPADRHQQRRMRLDLNAVYVS